MLNYDSNYSGLWRLDCSHVQVPHAHHAVPPEDTALEPQTQKWQLRN